MTSGDDNPFRPPQSELPAEEAIAFPELVACGRNLRAVYHTMLVQTSVVAVLAITMAVVRDAPRGVFLAIAAVFTLTSTGCLVAACGFLWKAADVPPEVATGRMARLAAGCAALLVPVATLIFYQDGAISVPAGGILGCCGGICFSLFGSQLAIYMQSRALQAQSRRMLAGFVIPFAFPALQIGIGDMMAGFVGIIYALLLFTTFGNLVRATERTIVTGG